VAGLEVQRMTLPGKLIDVDPVLRSAHGTWVEVGDRHIDAGIADDCWRCAGALAIGEALERLRRPAVGGDGPAARLELQWIAGPGSGLVPRVWVDEEIVCLPEVAAWATPSELKAFVDCFDAWLLRGGPRPVPFNFRLPEPQQPEGPAWAAAAGRGLMSVAEVSEDTTIERALAWLRANADQVRAFKDRPAMTGEGES
jgi:hypothetical protein